LGIETDATAAVVVDWDTGRALLEKQADQRMSIASVSKLMTALVVVESDPDWNQLIEIRGSDMRVGGIQYMGPGDKLTLQETFKVMLVSSSNEAAVALSRSIGASESEFVERMNETARRLGMSNTNFEEPTGLDQSNQASARDIAVLVRSALRYDVIREPLLMSRYYFETESGTGRTARNTDDLLGSFLDRPPYVFLGGKTGYQSEAGYCFAAAAENADGNRVIAVALGASSKEQRFKDVKAMIFWAFDAYVWPSHH
jgi:D-alanyl-D-alanine carboxypeptidase